MLLLRCERRALGRTWRCLRSLRCCGWFLSSAINARLPCIRCGDHWSCVRRRADRSLLLRDRHAPDLSRAFGWRGWRAGLNDWCADASGARPCGNCAAHQRVYTGHDFAAYADCTADRRSDPCIKLTYPAGCAGIRFDEIPTAALSVALTLLRADLMGIRRRFQISLTRTVGILIGCDRGHGQTLAEEDGREKTKREVV